MRVKEVATFLILELTTPELSEGKGSGQGFDKTYGCLTNNTDHPMALEQAIKCPPYCGFKTTLCHEPFGLTKLYCGYLACRNIKLDGLT